MVQNLLVNFNTDPYMNDVNCANLSTPILTHGQCLNVTMISPIKTIAHEQATKKKLS